MDQGNAKEYLIQLLQHAQINLNFHQMKFGYTGGYNHNAVSYYTPLSPMAHAPFPPTAHYEPILRGTIVAPFPLKWYHQPMRYTPNSFHLPLVPQRSSMYANQMYPPTPMIPRYMYPYSSNRNFDMKFHQQQPISRLHLQLKLHIPFDSMMSHYKGNPFLHKISAGPLPVLMTLKRQFNADMVISGNFIYIIHSNQQHFAKK